MAASIPYSIASNAKEFLAGIVAEQASYYKDKEKAAKDINTFISDVDKDLREVYDKYIPNVHVVDAASFTNILANRIAQAGKNILDPGSDTGIAARFGDPSSKEYRGLHDTVLKNLRAYHEKLLSSQGAATNPLAELNRLANKLFVRTRKIENAVSARVLGTEFSRDIRRVFGNKAVLAAVDSSLGSSDTRFVFFTSSFNALGSPMKANVYKPIEDYIKDTLGTDVVSGFALGSLVNAGHAAIVSDLESFVNSPAFAQVIYGVGSKRSARTQDVREAAELFKIESKLLENKIEVQKEFLSSNQGYGVLLSLGITFTNIEDAALNAQRGRESEAPAVRRFSITKPTALTNSAKKSIADKLLRIVFRSNPLLGKSSRNVVEFVRDSVVGILKGTPTKSESSKTTLKSSKSVNKVSKNTKGKQTKFNNPNSTYGGDTRLNKVEQAVKLSLVNLQRLINSRLETVIASNMGSGYSTSVLNYRTGRLAASAKVERLTLSREGMITAFYSYMRNPYGTFSEGGKQSIPKSRDPKLLISKSIKEIAATEVANRMRAVLV